MILVKGYGQMCNNILQYAHIYAFGRAYGVKTLSMRFAYKYRHFALCKKWYHNPLSYLASKLLIQLRLIPCIDSEPTEEVAQRLRQRPLIAYDGWMLRYPELFQKYREEIRELFTIHAPIEARVATRLASYPEADITLGLHIRRGDYARWQGGKYFFADEVYHRLIREFCALHPDKQVRVLICTNDPKLDLPSYQAVHPKTYWVQGSAIEELCLLSHCDYIIGVKSTFSLWASFYRDLPLCWVDDQAMPLTPESFQHFDQLYLLV